MNSLRYLRSFALLFLLKAGGVCAGGPNPEIIGRSWSDTDERNIVNVVHVVYRHHDQETLRLLERMGFKVFDSAPIDSQTRGAWVAGRRSLGGERLMMLRLRATKK